MAKVKKNCRICGKEYTPCSYCENDQMAFHYRTICCSRKCAEIYLARVLEARSKQKETVSDNVKNEDTNQEKNESENIEVKDTSITDIEDKPKRKYTKKKQVESENSEQIEESVGTLD